MAEPVKLPCGHLYCLSCFKNRYELKKRCRRCKFNIESLPRNYAKIDFETQSNLAELYPAEFKAKKLELIKDKTWQGNKIPIKFVYGNYHKISDANAKLHEYNLFFELEKCEELSEKFIDRVDFVLNNPKKNNPVYTKTAYPYFFESETAWGSYDAKIVVSFKGWTGFSIRIIPWSVFLAGSGKKCELE